MSDEREAALQQTTQARRMGAVRAIDEPIVLLHEKPLGRFIHQRRFACPNCGKKRWGIVSACEARPRPALLCSRCYLGAARAVLGDRAMTEGDIPAVTAEIRRRAGL